MARLLRKIKEKIRLLSGKIAENQEAITFAEAGQHEYAEELLQKKKVEKIKKPRKLVVVGRKNAFPRELIDYSLKMAQRMSSDLMAISIAPFSSDVLTFFPSSRDKMCQEFQELSEKNARLFQEEANRKGVHFEHLVKFTGTDEALEEIGEEVQINLVISENEGEGGAARIENGERTRRDFIVYTMS